MALFALIFWIIVLAAAGVAAAIAAALGIAIVSATAIALIAVGSAIAGIVAFLLLRKRFFPAAEPIRIPLLTLFPLFFLAVAAAHATLLHLPYFWDEGGYYIPAALDFFHTGSLIPHSTITNAHPPVPSVLLASLWRMTGVHILATRVFVCLVAAAALLAVFRLARTFLSQTAAAAVTLLTAAYPIWYVQSTLAHADIFAAAFTLWALALYLEAFAVPAAKRGAPFMAQSHRDMSGPAQFQATPQPPTTLRLCTIAILFTFSALSKETAVVTPFALALHRLWLLASDKPNRKAHLRSLASLAFCVVPLIAWYAYHRHVTGFVFGNPEYLRYNATANMDAHRTVLSLYHRLLHLLGHMNMYVATGLAAACFLLPARDRFPIPRRVLAPIVLTLLVNWIAFAVLGGALLTRYLLPMYPLLLLLCVAIWHQRTRLWPLVTALTAAAFVIALHVNPPYAFAPEDNLTYRDMIVLHQQAVSLIATRYPQATVLTAWPANAELMNTFLGYTAIPIKTVSLQNFALDQLQSAAQSPGDFDTALLFSTKYEPPAGRRNLSASMHNSDARYFDFHRDLLPAEAAALLHGDVVWQAERNGEWAAVLRFPRIVNASLSADILVVH